VQDKGKRPIGFACVEVKNVMNIVVSTLETSFEDRISAGHDTEAKIFVADAGGVGRGRRRENSVIWPSLGE
jgi:hypothetical protein